MKRERMLQTLTNIIKKIKIPHPLQIAIDGVDAAGKTTFADELAFALKSTNREIIRASVDDFHNPVNIRTGRGAFSPIGFYHDSFNYPALITNLLSPLGPKGDCRYRTAIFDLEKDQPVNAPQRIAARDAIIILDGIFLLRSELIDYWNLTIYLDVDFTHAVKRGIDRDAELFGSTSLTKRKYRRRYVPGQQLYLKDACPLDKADILIDNNKLEDPKFIRISDEFLSKNTFWEP